MTDRVITYPRYRPPWSSRAANLVAETLSRIGFHPDWNAGRMLARAQARAKLSDIGDNAFMPPFDALLHSLSCEVALHPLGRLYARNRLLETLVRRLYLERDLKLHPEISAVRIRRPLIVLGLPRSGTSLLQGLLAQDPRSISLRRWELAAPWPLPSSGHSAEQGARFARYQADVSRAARRYPRLHAMHSFFSPLECNELFTLTFRSTLFPLCFVVPSYDRWLELRPPEEWEQSYRYYLRVLRRLTWRREDKHWVLKSPHHLAHLEALAGIFPDLCAIQLHRDPQRVVSSTCSMTAAVRAMVQTRVDLDDVRRYVMRTLTALVKAGMDSRRKLGSSRFMDLAYADLVQDPIGAVRKIYSYFDLDLLPEAEDPMKQWLAMNSQHKNGVHRHSLAPFRLSRQEVELAFSGYVAAADILPERQP